MSSLKYGISAVFIDVSQSASLLYVHVSVIQFKMKAKLRASLISISAHLEPF